MGYIDALTSTGDYGLNDGLGWDTSLPMQGGQGFNWMGLLGKMFSGGAAGGPMGLVGGGLLSMAPLLLKNFFQRNDPQARFNQMVQQLTSPGYLNQLTQQNFSNTLNSPAFSQAQRGILGASNAMANTLGNRMAAQLGGASSRFSQAAGPMGRANAGLNMGQLYADQWGNAGNMAQNQIGTMLGRMGMVPSYNNNLIAGGLNSWLPLAFRQFNYGSMPQNPMPGYAGQQGMR